MMHSKWLAAALAVGGLTAQDMIGVSFTGQVFHMDSATGSATVIASGQAGKNGMAFTADNRLWTTTRVGTVGNFQYHLAVIDPLTGAESFPFGTTDFGDLRALAGDSVGNLVGVREGSPSDFLVRINVQTGVLTTVGPMGFALVQALDSTAGGLRAWDLTAGLLLVNASTGAATDAFPGIGGGNQQFLVTNTATNATFLGGSSLTPLSILTGATGTPLAFAGAPDLRGAEFLTSRVQLFGVGCGGALGPGLTPFGPGQAMTLTSSGHTPNSLGLQILGVSDAAYAGLPLPLQLDPLLGTSGCRLWVSADVTTVAVALPAGNMPITVTLPASIAFQQFFAQHMSLSPTAPGGLIFTGGARVRSSLF